MPNAFLQEKLSQLSDEELLALEKELMRKQQEGGGRGVLRGAVEAGAKAMSAESRRLLPTQLNILMGRDVGPAATTGTDLGNFEAKERIKSELDKERIRELTGAGAGVGEEGRFRAKGFTTGGVSFEREKTTEEIEQEMERTADAKARIKEKTDLVEQKSKIRLGRLVSRSNLELISGVTHDLANVYTGAVEEGGAGGFIQSGIAGAATAVGDLPGGVEVGGRFPASGAFTGKRQELILKMMPMLTQQATKPEGSVRLIEGVLRAIGQTIPDRKTAPRTARRQLEESLSTFYRFTRSAELLGLEFDKVFKDKSAGEVKEDEINSWVNSISALSSRIKIEDEELGAVEDLINTSLSPIDKLLEKRGERETPKAGKAPSQVEIDDARRRGAVGYDTDRGVFVDANGNPI